MSREWAPGDVARVRYGDVDQIGLVRVRRSHTSWALEFAYVDGGYDMVSAVEADARPLVVIDPEDREQIERLRASLDGMSFAAWACGAATCLQAALREFANPTPPKPQVYSHLATVGRDGIAEAMCGKVWRPGEDVTVVGECEACKELVSRWIA